MGLLTVTISRAGQSALTLSAAGGYRVRSIGPGARSWRLEEIEGPYQHGSAVVSARLARATLPLQVAVVGSSHAQVESRVLAMVEALSQLSYTLTASVGESSPSARAWRCHPADIVPVAAGERGGQGAWDEGLLRQNLPRQVYRITIPRQPAPTQGAL